MKPVLPWDCVNCNGGVSLWLMPAGGIPLDKLCSHHQKCKIEFESEFKAMGEKIRNQTPEEKEEMSKKLKEIFDERTSIRNQFQYPRFRNKNRGRY